MAKLPDGVSQLAARIALLAALFIHAVSTLALLLMGAAIITY